MPCQLMKQNLLSLLRKQWVTPLIALNKANCLSLSQRCGEFRRQGINVESKWVDLPSGKRCKAYRITKKPVGFSVSAGSIRLCFQH